MCLPHDRYSLIAWLETQQCVLRAWRDELTFDEGADTVRIAEIEHYCGWLALECWRLKCDLGFESGRGLDRDRYA